MFPEISLDLLWFDQVDTAYARQAVIYLEVSKWEIHSTEISYMNPVYFYFWKKVNTVKTKFPMAETSNMYFFSFFLIPDCFTKSKKTMKKEFFFIMVYITWTLLNYSSNYVVPLRKSIFKYMK